MMNDPTASRLEWPSRDEAATEAFGRALASVLPPGSVVALDGPLGAGKTRLVQAVCAAEGIDPHTVTSPTFVLVHEYESPRRPIFHFDAYRLRDEDEFLQIGADEYFQRGGWCFIEWADKVAAALPRRHISIRIELDGPTARTFVVTASDSTIGDLAKLKEAWGET